jgi:hypothetical protein
MTTSVATSSTAHDRHRRDHGDQSDHAAEDSLSPELDELALLRLVERLLFRDRAALRRRELGTIAGLAHGVDELFDARRARIERHRGIPEQQVDGRVGDAGHAR